MHVLTLDDLLATDVSRWVDSIAVRVGPKDDATAQVWQLVQDPMMYQGVHPARAYSVPANKGRGQWQRRPYWRWNGQRIMILGGAGK